jgi:acid phosphatase class B
LCDCFIAGIIQKKNHEVEMAKQSMQNNQIRKIQTEAVKLAENNSIMTQLKRSEQEEVKRLETKRAIKHQSQTQIKQYLDTQKHMKVRNAVDLKLNDHQMAKFGIEIEEKDHLKRNEYFEKLRKFQDINDQKTKNLIKYMQADPKALAEERDKKIYIDGIQQQEKKWKMRDSNENKRRQFDIETLKAGLNNQIIEK